MTEGRYQEQREGPGRTPGRRWKRGREQKPGGSSGRVSRIIIELTS